MFNSQELAKKALERVEQINKAKRRKKAYAVIASTVLCICATFLFIQATDADTDLMIAESETPTRIIEETPVPLANPPPLEPTPLCTICGQEIEALETDNNNNNEQEEKCEHCQRE